MCVDTPTTPPTPMTQPRSSSEVDKTLGALPAPYRVQRILLWSNPRKHANLLLAPLTMNSEDGANDIKGLGANFGTRGDVCAAGTADGMSAGRCRRAG